MLRFVAPLLQVAVPLAFCAISLTTHVLVGGLARFGIGSGGPNSQPDDVQCRSPKLGVPLGVEQPAGTSAAVVLVRFGLPAVHEAILV